VAGKKGEKLKKNASGFVCDRMYVFCKKEFGIECKVEVSNGGAPRNNGMYICLYAPILHIGIRKV